MRRLSVSGERGDGTRRPSRGSSRPGSPARRCSAASPRSPRTRPGRRSRPARPRRRCPRRRAVTAAGHRTPDAADHVGTIGALDDRRRPDRAPRRLRGRERQPDRPRADPGFSRRHAGSSGGTIPLAGPARHADTRRRARRPRHPLRHRPNRSRARAGARRHGCARATPGAGCAARHPRRARGRRADAARVRGGDWHDVAIRAMGSPGRLIVGDAPLALVAGRSMSSSDSSSAGVASGPTASSAG